MSIEHRIDHAKRLVRTRAYGKLTDDEILAYQRELRSRDDIAGYNELFDLTDVEEFDTLSAGKLREIAASAADLDSPEQPAKCAIVAPHSLHFGISRMYEVFRQLHPGTTKVTRSFAARQNALRWLKIEE